LDKKKGREVKDAAIGRSRAKKRTPKAALPAYRKSTSKKLRHPTNEAQKTFRSTDEANHSAVRIKELGKSARARKGGALQASRTRVGNYSESGGKTAKEKSTGRPYFWGKLNKATFSGPGRIEMPKIKRLNQKRRVNLVVLKSGV